MKRNATDVDFVADDTVVDIVDAIETKIAVAEADWRDLKKSLKKWRDTGMLFVARIHILHRLEVRRKIRAGLKVMLNWSMKKLEVHEKMKWRQRYLNSWKLKAKVWYMQ